MPESRADVVDPDLADYIAAHSSKPDEVQRRLMDVTVERTGGAARMQIGGDQGTFFEILVRSMGATRAIEVGTFTGYSALSIVRGMGPQGRLLCLDVSAEWTAIAREHWELAGVADRIELRLGPALDSIAALATDATFDVAFIDADKSNYHAYFEALLPHMRPGGVILVDNTLWSRQVLDAAAEERDTVALRAFNRAVADDPRVRCVIVPMGDGVTVLQRVSG
jgi:caffeoyl-CoA O-methyltransferase